MACLSCVQSAEVLEDTLQSGELSTAFAELSTPFVESFFLPLPTPVIRFCALHWRQINCLRRHRLCPDHSGLRMPGSAPGTASLQ